MEQKSVHRFIYKLESRQLKKANWKLTLPLKTAMKICPESIVSLNNSQCLRFIDEINGVEDINGKVRAIQRKIRGLKKEPKTQATKALINSYYKKLYELQFQKDYLCVIMASEKDYDRANEGFSVNYGEINGKECIVHYRRFLGTNGGIKNSTIVYVNEEIYPELKKRLDNGRNKQAKLVPAKLEAYQALICSGSTPLPEPKGFIVVHDCVTKFKEDVIVITDEAEGEPVLTYEDNFEIEHDDSDGFGLMLPSYSRKVNEYLTGDGEHEISGMNTRTSWLKGMVYTFDFIEFAEKIAGTYEVIDVWGDKRDIRDAEVILTESQLKLWDCYESWEDYYRNCKENHYEFATPKITPQELEGVRDTNYQFLQSYEFTDEEIQELCQPTVDEIKEVIGLDYRKSLAFLAGFGLNEKNVLGDHLDSYVKALMIEPQLINDPFIRRKIYNMIRKRIEMGERGAIRINANFAMIGGDPYALMQSIFGLPVTGLLKKGEIYHKYWIDKGADEIVCFRAPMTCANNVTKLKLCKSDDAAYWFRYIKTAALLNAWDTTCEAMNGADKDGDTFMCTDNPILLKNTKNLRTIVCVQRKAEKIIPTEEDIIKANKLAFNDDIGVITNHVTSMFDVQAGFEKGSKEYETLSYRIMCGQHYQQCSIDRAKGIIAKPMPSYWHTLNDCKSKPEDDEETKELKDFNYRIAAAKKPYFMTYVYPRLRTENLQYEKNCLRKLRSKFYKNKPITMDDFYTYNSPEYDAGKDLEYYLGLLPTGNNPCTVNRISWFFEKEFKGCLSNLSSRLNSGKGFNYEVLKSQVAYAKSTYNAIYNLFLEYIQKTERLIQKARTEKIDNFATKARFAQLAEFFKMECFKICPNEKQLCDIVIDICYGNEKYKQFAWDICSEVIIENLLERHNGMIKFPALTDEDDDFVYCGRKFKMEEIKVGVAEE